jgi:hypothetical protein
MRTLGHSPMCSHGCSQVVDQNLALASELRKPGGVELRIGPNNGLADIA